MDKNYGIMSSVLVASSLATTSLHAATTCAEYSFIYNKTFDLGDGEGMETRQCNETNFKKGDAVFSKMQGMVKAGQHQQARKELARALSVNADVEYSKLQANAELCVRPSQAKSFETLVQQIGKNIAADAERAGNMHGAIDTAVTYCLYDEAARMHLILAEKKPTNIDAVRDAYAFGKKHQNNALTGKVRQIATNTSNSYLTEENNFFKTNMYNSYLLEQAISLLNAVDDKSGKDNVIKKAESRGDELAKQDNCRVLDSAIEYYKIAGNSKKIPPLKSRALKIGENLEKQGNLKPATVCYKTADADAKSSKLSDVIEVQSQKEQEKSEKNEKSRKEKFNKEQDDLEKELQL